MKTLIVKLPGSSTFRRHLELLILVMILRGVRGGTVKTLDTALSHCDVLVNVREFVF